jgi:hypothetical protein
VSCAGVWGLILAAGKRWADPQDWDRLRVTCAGWWMGWTSATIARVAYPAPTKLDPEAEKRLGNASLALVVIGLANVIRVLARSRQAR